MFFTMMVANMANHRPLNGKPEASGNTKCSLLELVYKLRQAEFRVYGKVATDEVKAFTKNEIASEDIYLEKQSEEKLKDEATQIPFSAPCSSCLLSNIDFSFGQVTEEVSLKSIQDRYRMFKASFPRFTESETASASDICKYVVAVAENPLKDKLSLDSFLKILPSQKTASAVLKDIEVAKRHLCDWCSYQTDSRSHLIRHLKSVHSDVIKDILKPESSSGLCSATVKSDLTKRAKWCNISTRRFKCDMCVYSTDCLSHLRRHQGCVHNKMMSYWCYICKKDFSRSEKTKSHFIAFHPSIPYDPKKIRKFSPPPREKCKKVGKINIKIKHQKKREEKNSNRERKISEIMEKTNEIKAIKKKSGFRGREKRYACPKCSYVSHGLWHMKRHMVDIHETEKEYSCKVCCYAASRQHRIVSHMHTHGELFCLFCDYSNADTDIFNRHFSLCSVMHRVRTVVRCHVCHVDCADPKQLKMHINEMHSLILHSCDICPYYTDIPDEIYAHARLHVDDEQTCKLCNIMFAADDQLNHHITSKHVTQSNKNSYLCAVCCREEKEFSEIVHHVQMHPHEVLLCGHDLCKFKCTVENSRRLHWRYYHNNCGPNGVAVSDESQTPISSADT